MKIYKYLLVIIGLGFINNSCDLLKEEPEHILVSENFYRTPEEALASVNAVYQRLAPGMYNRVINMMTDLPTDDLKNGQGMNNAFLIDLEYYNFTSENTFAGQTWMEHFDGINRANVVLGRVPQVAMDETLKQRILGEAHFLRALFYFNLVRFYGKVPIVTTETGNLNNLNLERAPVEEVYALIIEDLKFAETSLPAIFSGADLGRATQGAAKILLGKVYLTKKDWANAVKKLEEVIKNEATYKYELHPNFRDNFVPATENTKEMVFSVQLMENPGQPNGMMILDAPRTRVPGLTGQEADIPTLDVYNAFKPGDTRRDATFFTSYTRNNATTKFPFPLYYKYFDEGAFSKTAQSNVNVHILRYADALLMYAEALNELSGPTPEAYTAINRVRRRAFKDNLHDLTGLNQASFREAVYEERRLEFVKEGQRWFDLVRTGRLLTVMQNHKENGTINIKPHNILYPVPQRERDVNPKLDQNDGY